MNLTVHGTGYLGAVHAACLAELGFEVLGTDIDQGRIATLRTDLATAELAKAAANAFLATKILFINATRPPGPRLSPPARSCSGPDRRRPPPATRTCCSC